MQIGVIGLGARGARLARTLLAMGHQCVVFDASPRLVAELGAEKAYGAASLADVANELDPPRIIWLAEPPGGVDATIAELRRFLHAGDLIVDCGPSSHLDDIRRARSLSEARIHYVDVGVNGGGDTPCLTVGGETAAVRRIEPLLKQLAAPRGYLHCGRPGAGHFVRMIHSAVERCLAAAYAEGLGVLRGASEYDFNLGAIATAWKNGSMVSSPVLERLCAALAQDPTLHTFAGQDLHQRDEWSAIRAAVDEAIPTPVLMSAMFMKNP
ncbi:MAG TPA: NAD(P)-binding domain-containing protein [Vicinamibacterales bacterium]